MAHLDRREIGPRLKETLWWAKLATIELKLNKITHTNAYGLCFHQEVIHRCCPAVWRFKCDKLQIYRVANHSPGAKGRTWNTIARLARRNISRFLPCLTTMVFFNLNIISRTEALNWTMVTRDQTTQTPNGRPGLCHLHCRWLRWVSTMSTPDWGLTARKWWFAAKVAGIIIHKPGVY